MIKKFQEFLNENSPAPFINWPEIGERIVQKFAEKYPDKKIEWKFSEKAFYVDNEFAVFIDRPLAGVQMTDEEIMSEIEKTMKEKDYIYRYENGEFEFED